MYVGSVTVNEVKGYPSL